MQSGDMRALEKVEEAVGQHRGKPRSWGARATAPVLIACRSGWTAPGMWALDC